jgi:hypothetical protein
MRRSRWTDRALLAALTLCLAGPSAARSFTAPEAGVGFELPAGWVEIPSAELTRYEREVRRRAGGRREIDYDYAFQADATADLFSYPYILVRVARDGRIPEPQLARLDRCWTPDTARHIERQVHTLARQLEIEKPYFDPAARIVWMRSSANVTNVGRVAGITALVPTEYGSVQIHGYAYADDFEGFVGTFHAAIASLQVADEVQYRTRTLERIPVIGWVDWGKALWAGAAGAAAAGVIGLLRRAA